MIHDLDDTLKELLVKELPPPFQTEDGEPSVSVTFDTLQKGEAPQSLTLDLFLYDVRENKELRNNERRVERQDGQATIKRAPVRVECSYLITAWGNDVKTEHQLLSEAMKVLLRNSPIPQGCLSGELKTQNIPLPTACLEPGRLQSPGDIWQIMGGKPRAALHYTVTLAVPMTEKLDGTVVTTVVAKYGHTTHEAVEQLITIGGRILQKRESGNEPVKDAETLLETTDGKLLRTTRTDETGSFTFGGLRTGTYQLRVRPEGLAERTREVTIPTAGAGTVLQLYDVQY